MNIKRWGDKATINVDGSIWRVKNDFMLGSGVDASAYMSPDYPDLVLLIFPYKYQYKYDWFRHMNLIYGESTWNKSHVLILPKMKKTSPARWYSELAGTLNGDSVENRYPEMIEIIDGIENGSIKEDKEYEFWIKEFVLFLNRYPKYKSDSIWFDLHSGNIMNFNGRDIIIDPIWIRRNTF